MKVIRIYSNGKRIVGNSRAFISPYANSYTEYDLSALTDEEFKKIENDPNSFKIDS